MCQMEREQIIKDIKETGIWKTEEGKYAYFVNRNCFA